MGDFKKRSSFGGGRDDKRGGGFRGGFGGGSKFGRGGAGGGFRQSEMFSTTCAECHKSCEDPFRPNGEKPVYCSDCFRNKGGSSDFPQRDNRGESRGRDFPKREFSQPARPQFDGGNTADLKKQLDSMSSKLDRLMEMVMKNSSPIAQESASKRVDVIELAKVVKKATNTPKKEVKKVVAPVKKVEAKKVEVKASPKKKPVSKKK
jgi:CxxC-x17-CxxC domain-containing protein